ncbi:MAG TPA: hypothetical protein VJS68_00500, partial [Thermoplasmata archaeon]|nr:hypothetical protein [Thermoplasmata archaeon]
YVTYGEFGDVLLYHPNGNTAITPIVHRALVYLEVNADGTVSIPELSGLPCGPSSNSVYTLASSPSGCGTSHVSGLLTLHHVGWQSVNVTIDLSVVGPTSGFITMGDNNLAGAPPSQGVTDQESGRSAVVQEGWIIGSARGMLPWFGAVTLLLEGNAQEVPSQSWELMGITIIALVLGAMGIHYLFRAEGIEDERRLELEAEQAEEEDEVRPRRRRWFSPLREWRSEEEEEEDDSPEERRPRHRVRRSRGRSETHGSRRGRPVPKVRRENHRAAHRPRHPDSSDEL